MCEVCKIKKEDQEKGILISTLLFCLMHTYVDLLRPRLLTQLTARKRLLHSSNASDCGGGGGVFGSDCTVQIIMATQFVKWWKTKFHTSTTCGYKNISVLGSDTSDGRPSDTEDLVKDDASSASNLHGAHVNAGLATSSASSIHSHDHHLEYKPSEVKFEDFECDVHVEGSESGEERKEFSFTFYDLDGHGKITKDDIAGLVRSIYGAVNELPITVPQGGKKTIKVRLTVTPEKQNSNCSGQENHTSQNNNNNNNNNNNQHNINNNNNNLSGTPPPNAGSNGNNGNTPSRPNNNKLRNNVNVTICQENLNRERRLVGEGGRRPKFNSVRLPNHLSSCRGCHMSPEVFRDCSASPMRNRKKWRERACSVQRPDLFELLQANMEKNNVTPCCRQPHHHNSPPFCSHNHLIDPTCPVLPLLTSNHNNNNNNNSENLCNNNSGKLKLQLDHTSCSPRNKIYDSSHPHPRGTSGGGHQCKKHGHHRSRSHDLGQNLFKYHLLSERDQLLATPPNTNAPCNNNHSCINHLNHHEETLGLELLGGCIFNHSPKNSNIVNVPLTKLTTASPHQLKHRNREQEHKRAMAQVINWLERENIGMEKKFSSPKKMPHPLPATPPVKRHEHHHVHEHHHYHHYHTKETPIIV